MGLLEVRAGAQLVPGQDLASYAQAGSKVPIIVVFLFLFFFFFFFFFLGCVFVFWEFLG